MTGKGKPFAQDGFVRTPILTTIVTQGKVTIENGFRPTPTVATAQTPPASSGSGEKK